MLNATECAQGIASALEGAVAQPPYGNYPAEFAAAYNSYATAGVIAGAVNAGGLAAILSDVLQLPEITPQILGRAFALFWAGVGVIPLPPNIASINDAHTPALELIFIQAVLDSMTDEASVPHFGAFVENLEAAAKAITWTITSAGGALITTGVV